MKNLTPNQREILASIADDSDPDAIEVIREYLALRAWSKAARLRGNFVYAEYHEKAARRLIA